MKRRAPIFGAAASLFAWPIAPITFLFVRPVNDDYWALGSLHRFGFLGSLKWYHVEFQGNVTSWLFIILHEQLWLHGVTAFGAVPSVLITLLLLTFSVLGFRRFLGLKLVGSLIPILAALIWLSLDSVISPNSMTFVYYIPSAIVHVWPWLLALAALGLMASDYRSRWLLPVVFLMSVAAGSLGFVEGVAIGIATAVFTLYERIRLQGLNLWRSAARTWTAGILSGLAIQLAAPSTWNRSTRVVDPQVTNIEAVGRLFSAIGKVSPQLASGLQSMASPETWAQILVPFAVLGDLLARPGLVALLFIAAWLAKRGLLTSSLSPELLRDRVTPLKMVVVISFVLYSVSGAMYAYAGRHVAGLAVLVALIGIFFGMTNSGRLIRTGRVAVPVSVIVFLLIGAQQFYLGYSRMVAWDKAQRQNLLILKGEASGPLINVPLKAGISQSGLRDHDGSREYQEWLLRWNPH